jgi:HEAT repeat protein
VEGLDDELLTLLVSDEPAPVRRSAIRALGYLRSEPAVPALTAIAGGQGTLGRDACFALARIRSPVAVESLSARLSAEADPEWRELLEFLVSPDFVEQERGLGRDLPAE